MFRLIKSLNGNNKYEVAKLRSSGSLEVVYGSALTCSGSGITSPSATASPDFIALSAVESGKKTELDGIVVSEDMVFKVEYTGASTPYVGMFVGLSSYKGSMDAVSYNSSGKGIILAIDDDPKIVYVRFRK